MNISALVLVKNMYSIDTESKSKVSGYLLFVEQIPLDIMTDISVYSFIFNPGILLYYLVNN